MSFRIILSVLFAMIFLGGCHDSSVDDNDNVGSIQGTVTLLGIDGLPLQSHGGATVGLEGTPFHATTDANGQWQLNNVPAGVYTVLFSKQGFDTTIIPNYHFTGAGTAFINGPPDGGTIEKLPNDSVFFSISEPMYRSDTVASNGDTIHKGQFPAPGLLAVNGIVKGTDNPNFYIIVSRDSARDKMEATYGNFGYGSANLKIAIGQPFSDTLNINQYGLWPKTGDTLYVRIVGRSEIYWQNNGYFSAYYLHQPTSPYSELHSYIVK